MERARAGGCGRQCWPATPGRSRSSSSCCTAPATAIWSLPLPLPVHPPPPHVRGRHPALHRCHTLPSSSAPAVPVLPTGLPVAALARRSPAPCRRHLPAARWCRPATCPCWRPPQEPCWQRWQRLCGCAASLLARACPPTAAHGSSNRFRRSQRAPLQQAGHGPLLLQLQLQALLPRRPAGSWAQTSGTGGRGRSPRRVCWSSSAAAWTPRCWRRLYTRCPPPSPRQPFFPPLAQDHHTLQYQLPARTPHTEESCHFASCMFHRDAILPRGKLCCSKGYLAGRRPGGQAGLACRSCRGGSPSTWPAAVSRGAAAPTEWQRWTLWTSWPPGRPPGVLVNSASGFSHPHCEDLFAL